MNIVLERHSYSPAGTFGRLFVGDKVFHTVEREWLGNKTYDSCIPEGVYDVTPYSSEKYPNVWELQNVPGRSKILIHVANNPRDVQGCIGLGMSFYGTGVSDSRYAMQLFRELMHGVDKFTIEINQFRVEYP